MNKLLQLAELAEESRVLGWHNLKVCKQARLEAIGLAQKHHYPISCLAKLFNVTDQQLHSIKRAGPRSG